jgi:GT2 family glycosyltransferase
MCVATKAVAAAPGVTAVVVSYNGGERTLRVLRALQNQTTALAAVLVVDNGSTDGSQERIRTEFPGVELMHMAENRGLPAARNAGLRRATTDLVLLLDHDVYVDAHCVAAMLDLYRERQPTVICPRVRLDPERDVIQTDGAEAHFIGTMTLRRAGRNDGSSPELPQSVPACIGACMLVQRRLVLEAGGFDELFFFYFEDHEFCLRLRSLGHEILWEPRAVVYHERGAGTPGLSFRGRGAYPARRLYFTVRHRLVTILVHYNLRTLLVLAPALGLYELAGGALAVATGHGQQWGNAWTWAFANAGAIRDRRRRMQRTRQVRDRDLLSGGPLPLAPGLLDKGAARAAADVLSAILEGYWQLTRRWVA